MIFLLVRGREGKLLFVKPSIMSVLILGQGIMYTNIISRVGFSFQFCEIKNLPKKIFPKICQNLPKLQLNKKNFSIFFLLNKQKTIVQRKKHLLGAHPFLRQKVYEGKEGTQRTLHIHFTSAYGTSSSTMGKVPGVWGSPQNAGPDLTTYWPVLGPYFKNALSSGPYRTKNASYCT